MSKRQSPNKRQSEATNDTDSGRWLVRDADGVGQGRTATKREAVAVADGYGPGASVVRDPDTDDETTVHTVPDPEPEADPEPDTDSEPEATTEPDTEPKRATVAERVEAFRAAFVTAATDPGPEHDAEALARFLAVPPSKRDAERLAALGVVVTEHGSEPEALAAASALGSSLAAAQSAPAPERGPDPATVLANRVAALANLAAGTVAHALSLADPAGDTDTDDPEAVAARLAAFGGDAVSDEHATYLAALAFVADPDRSDDDERATWRSAFGGSVPDPARLPGRRGGSGGGGRSAGRSLDALPVGLALADRYRGTTLAATVEATTDADGVTRHVLRLADGSEHASPTAAARAARQPLAADGVTVSVNGWTDAWRVADADGQPTSRTLADAHDAATGSDDDTDTDA